MTLNEFYTKAKSLGCCDGTYIIVEHCDLNRFHENSAFVEPDVFVITPVILEDDHTMTLKEFYEECIRFGCDEDTTIKVFYCNISQFNVRECDGEIMIFID